MTLEEAVYFPQELLLLFITIFCALQLLRRHRQKNTGGSTLTSEEVCSLPLAFIAWWWDYIEQFQCSSYVDCQSSVFFAWFCLLMHEFKQYISMLLTKLLWDARKVCKTAFWKPWFDYPLVVSQANNLRVMLLGMVDDPRVVLIKLADRLHNMRTMYATLGLSSLFSMSCLLLVS